MSRLLGKAEKAAKPAAMEQYVTLVVTDQEGRRLTRTMRSTDKLQAMMDFYYDLVPAVERGDGVFMRCGRRILGCRTPEDCGMKDGDVIQFFPNIKPDMLVTLVLQDFRGRSLTRTMRKTDGMQVLMDFYAAMVPAAGDGDGDGVFLYRGEPVAAEQTPAGLKMADWDRIYFVPRRRGEVKEDRSVDYITVRVRDDRERMIYCTVRRSEKLKPLMDLYHATVLGDGASILGGAFLFDGQRLHGRHTPAQLEMEVGDVVDYLPEQI